ncbi:glycosyltransferase [Actinokineospora bangkokensis]|uniref:Glycosyl transferase n=1 Tax=Actinokineospora bangkokensis TaxID=1193682 RepID=A0A1Q9LNU2_9PSEU|nr:glycosyltransferase family A protein [Actinokineospora bangkokensis]OLR93688.1 glycosyl transferase [Actinokineospora bangkokensis]
MIVRSAAWAGCAIALHTFVNTRLVRTPSASPPPCGERVSVLMPVRDEAHRVGPALRSVLAQTGVADLEVVVLDDGSTDGTADVVREIGGDRVRVVVGTPPPPGALGKPNACAGLAAEATGDVLVYVDADVVLAPHAVAAAVALLRANGLDLVSPFPGQLAEGWAARLAQPLLIWSILASLPLRLAERTGRPSMAVANGQFLVVDAAALRRCGGFESVRGEVLDDMAIARRVRVGGGRTAVVDGSGVARCRMYQGWAEVRDGYTKSLWSASGSPAAAGAFAAAFAWLFLLPPLAALRGSRAGLIGYAAAVVSRALAARRTGGRVGDAAAHPLSAALVLVLLARSWWGRRRGTLTWKGRALGGGG